MNDIIPDFENVTCAFGHQTPAEKQFERPDWWFELPGNFAWYRCPECGLLFLNPRPTLEKITTYYPPNYAAYRPAIDDEKWTVMRWKRRRNLRHVITAVTQRAAPGHLLDVGCATGNYLAEMKRKDWQVTGVELEPDTAEYARQRFGIDVFTGDLLESHFPSHSYDVVTLWDVLEHVYDPIAVLQEVHRILKPDGLLIFSIPDLDSVWAHRFGAAWIGYDAPRHLHLFHNENLQQLLIETGFIFEDREHFLATYHTWVASFHTWVNVKTADNLLRKIIIKVAYFPIWSLITSPYFHWLNKKSRGTDMTIYARSITK